LPRLSVTTSWKVTAPLVAGTETVTLGDGVVIEGLVGESATGGVVGLTIGMGIGVGVMMAAGWMGEASGVVGRHR